MNNQKISNQELFENFLIEHFKEKLIFSSKRVKKGLASMGAMYFIQQTQFVGDVKDIFFIQQYLHQLDNVHHPIKKLKY